MATERQIKRAFDNAAQNADFAAKADQIANFAATPEQMSKERGMAMNAAGFAAQALANLQHGDYDKFLTCLRLAGDFANDASSARYARVPK